MPEEDQSNPQPATPESEAAKPTVDVNARPMLKFPEDQIPHEPDKHAAAFNQFDPDTGWFWIGLHLQDFTFRRAWGIILSQYAALENLYSRLEEAMMQRARLMQNQPAKPNGRIAQVLANLRRR